MSCYMEAKHGSSGRCQLDERRATSVSFSRDRDEVNVDTDLDDNENDEDEDMQISLAPHIQAYLAHSSQRVEVCGIFMPVPFERAARSSWWNPRFDSEILENQYKASAFPQIRLRFRYCLIYLLLVSMSWCVFLLASGGGGGGSRVEVSQAHAVGVTFGLLACFCGGVLATTTKQCYQRHHMAVSVVFVVVVYALSLVSASSESALSPSGNLALCLQLLTLVYTVVPLPLYACVFLNAAYSCAFEWLAARQSPSQLATLLCHAAAHFVGVHTLVMTDVRMRGTFMKVGQSLLVRRQLELEKQLKEKMIHSVMPPKVAAWLMSEAGRGRRESRSKDETGDDSDGDDCSTSDSDESSDIHSLFRPFNMLQMENVSILFADIVGFTRMSSNKTAAQLVSLLNDLFERFDGLCAATGCEKISTLGDCYYCVSGCPEPRPDHAVCCLEMGLKMIVAIADFDRVRNEGVNMRVGVHTGTVLCGIVGTKRVKFDVWSNDVKLANKMESTGQPGRVHLSQATSRFLDDNYILEDGPVVEELKTYFVKCRKDERDLKRAEEEVEERKLREACPGAGAGAPAAVNVNVVSEGRLTRPVVPLSVQIKRSSLAEALCYSQTLLPLASSPNSPPILTENRPSKGLFPPRKRVWGGGTYRSPSLAFRMSESAAKASSLPSVLVVDESSSSPSPAKRGRSAMLFTKKKTAPTVDCKYSKLQTNDTENAVVEMLKKSSGSGSLQRLRTPSPEVRGGSLATNILQDQISVCPSVNSRKDSGIRSNSRRSSIQQQLFSMNGIMQGELLTHRVSGYYTSSQSTINDGDKIENGKNEVQLPSPFTDDLGVCFQKLRKQSDLQLIRCVQDNSMSQRSYFVQAPLSSFSLFFKQPGMEKEFRKKAYKSFNNDAATLATARFNTYLDIAVCLLVMSLLTVTSLLQFPCSDLWLAVVGSVWLIQLIAICFCLHSLFRPTKSTPFKRCMSWYPWHYMGGVLVSMPIILVLANFIESLKSYDSIYQYSCLVYIGLIHFCNFTQLNCWMKSILATTFSLAYICLITVYIPTSAISTNSSLGLYSCYSAPEQSLASNHSMNDFQIENDENNLPSIFNHKILIDNENTDNPSTVSREKYPSENRNPSFPQTHSRYQNEELKRRKIEILSMFPKDSTSIVKRSSSEYRSHRFYNNLDNDTDNSITKSHLLQAPVVGGLNTKKGLLSLLENPKVEWVDDGSNGSSQASSNFSSSETNFRDVKLFHGNLVKTFEIIHNIKNVSRGLSPGNISPVDISESNALDGRPLNTRKPRRNSFHLANFDKNSSNPKSEDKESISLSTLVPPELPENVFCVGEMFLLEIYLDIVLLLLLVWFLNREFEIRYRLSFHGNAVAAKDKERVQMMKDQADWLLHNIIPQHVAEHLKNTARYSENVANAGILFASIVNFSEMYDESYLGGRECLRVLNELISDFDELLDSPRFSMVEKIKTIGSTYMAASGLNPETRHSSDPDMHLYQLMEFAIALQEVINSFNRDLLEFNLIIRIGFNYGDVTAGVIGTSKLYYDIWGDAVNIASRMDSIGMPGRVQVPGDCLHSLSRWYDFTPRGQVYVKGKDLMNVYLLIGPKAANSN